LAAAEHRLVEEWARLVTEGMATLIGPIRQEILSGLRRPEVFQALRRALSDFPYLRIDAEDYDRAAEFFNLCRAVGIIGGPIDMLIAAVASRHEVPVFTLDRDYERYVRHLPFRLHLLGEARWRGLSRAISPSGGAVSRDLPKRRRRRAVVVAQ
jgi:predicted nucleic acid-binding protein